MILEGNYREVLRDVKADLIFTSPPYNIGSGGRARTGFRKHGKYDPKSYAGITDYPDRIDEHEYQIQQKDFLIWCERHLNPGGVVAYNHKNRRRDKTMISPHEWFPRYSLALVDEVVWDRGSTHNHDRTMLWPHDERVYVFRRAKDRRWTFNHDEGKHRSSVWRINRPVRNGHNCAYPEELALEVIRKWSPVGGLVCDPYSGSGTTWRAATACGRDFVGSELQTKYVELAKKLWDQRKY